ncbi:uncharacterized protein LOC121677407 [Alosa sapidissima]|uniref:uncharacterized protein LOC121677407 n=1 Tax=Alosa sapidissima TaxID=34773 RepID=UPI001C0A5B4A|nr:uncharacterized protein LOC121677407 [Alosa sapidissima]
MKNTLKAMEKKPSENTPAFSFGLLKVPSFPASPALETPASGADGTVPPSLFSTPTESRPFGFRAAVSASQNSESKPNIIGAWPGLQGSPWRQVDWSQETNAALMESIRSYKPACDSVPAARVLLIGPVGAGKSSFISSVQSVFYGRVVNRAMVGTSVNSSASFTKKLQSYQLYSSRERVDESMSLVLSDMVGLGETNGLTLHDTLAVIKGHVPEGHTFSACCPVVSDTPGYVKEPSLAEKVHCVVFVVSGLEISSYSDTMKSTFHQLRELISALDQSSCCTAGCMIMATVLCVLVCLFTGVQRLGGVRTLRNLTVQRGGSAVVPCHYEEKYVAQVKYWCRGYTWDTCRVLTRSSSVPSPPDAQVSISDDITQWVFTVTIRNLQDSDVYWCAVDIRGGSDDKAYLKITVTPGPPELYSESRVFSGPVGGLVQVRCLYGGRLWSGEKKWCRSGSSVCLTAGRTSRLHKYTLDADPRTGALSVTMRDLTPNDAGWYWCTGADTQLPVYVSVSPKTNTHPVTQREFGTNTPPVTQREFGTNTPPVTQRETTSTTHTTTAVQTVKTPFASEATALLQTSVEATPPALSDEAPGQEEHSEHSVVKIPSLEILLKIPLAVVYLVCLAVAIKKHWEMNR